MKALVLEENSRIIELYKKIFEQKNYQADFVSDVDACIGKFDDSQDYDLVILEKSMRIPEGETVEDLIRTSRPQQKVFFLSPYMSPRDMQFDAVKETLDLIDKPFAMISLLSSLEIKSVRRA
ncbi:MAG: response regulator [Thermoproteota archaeon]